MTGGASLPPNAPATNGTIPNGLREVDASSLRDVCADLHARVTAFLSASPQDERTRRTQEQTRIAIDVITKALDDYDFEALSLSYNGGKDCLVLLILYLSTLHTHYSQQSGRRKETSRSPALNNISEFPGTIPSIYAKPPDPFPSVTHFVESSSREYHLDLVHISTNPGPRPTLKDKSHSNPPPSDEPVPHIDGTKSEKKVSFRDAFALYLASHPTVKAIFVGTRRTDPHGGHLTHFDPTDGNWPKFMRIHPVIDWHLSEIWCFLRSPFLKNPDGTPLEYCSIYDQGYTSLGGVNDTVRNPKLRYTDEEGTEKYKPAYIMTEDEGERLGRE